MDWHHIALAIVASVLGVSLRPAEPIRTLPALPDGWRMYVWYEPAWDTVWWGPNVAQGIHEIVLISTTAQTKEEAANEVWDAIGLWPCSKPDVLTAKEIRQDWSETIARRNAAEPEHPTVDDLLWLWDLSQKTSAPDPRGAMGQVKALVAE